MAELTKRAIRWIEPNSGKILQTVMLTDGPVPKGSAIFITQFAYTDWRIRKSANGCEEPWLGTYDSYEAAENGVLALRWSSQTAGGMASPTFIEESQGA
jgi:hypothetical protein